MMKSLSRTILMYLSLAGAASAAAPIEILSIEPPANSSGLELNVEWNYSELDHDEVATAASDVPDVAEEPVAESAANAADAASSDEAPAIEPVPEAQEPEAEVSKLLLLRRGPEDTAWSMVGDRIDLKTGTDNEAQVIHDKSVPSPGTWVYKLVSVYTDTPDIPTPEKLAEDATEEEQLAFDKKANELKKAWLLAVIERSDSLGDDSDMATGTTRADWLNTNPGHLFLMALIVLIGALMMVYTRRAQRGEEIYIRRIPGIDAIEEGIGRSTEMGKPVLYVPGIDDLQDIQTIASMLILGQVSKTVAEYQSDLIVSCCIPIVREVADEVVKAGYYQAGHPDAYNASNIRFISSEQFAFCAGTNGIMLREKPATNIYFGRFFAESLILAETGFVNRSIQIAGTAEATQLPFFIAACDYTLIGEELFAVSAYLSKDPRLVSSLKASDVIKIICVAALILGTVLASIGNDLVINLFTISG